MITSRFAQNLIIGATLATLGIAVLLMSLASASDRERIRERDERARAALVQDADDRLAAQRREAEERLDAQRAAAGRAMAWAVGATAERFAELADIGPRETVPAQCDDVSTRDAFVILCTLHDAPPDRAWDRVLAWRMVCPFDGSPCEVKRGTGYPGAWGSP